MSIGISAGINGFVQGMQAGNAIKDRREEREWRKEDREWNRETRAEDREWRREDRDWQRETRAEDRDWTKQRRGWALDDREWTVAERERLAAERKDDKAWTGEQRLRQRELWDREDTEWERTEAEAARKAAFEAEERELLGQLGQGGQSGGIGLDGGAPAPGTASRPPSAATPASLAAGGEPVSGPDATDLGPRISRLPGNEPARDPAGRGPRQPADPSMEGAPAGARPAAADQREAQPQTPDPRRESPDRQPDTSGGEPEAEGYGGPTLMGDLRSGIETWDRWGTNLANSALGIGPAIWNNGKGAIEATGQYLTGQDIDLPEVEGLRSEGMFGGRAATEDDAQAEEDRMSEAERSGRYRHIDDALRGKGPGWSDYVSETQGYEDRPLVEDVPDHLVEAMGNRDRGQPGPMRVEVTGPNGTAPQAAEEPRSAPAGQQPAPAQDQATPTTREGTPAASVPAVEAAGRNIGLGGDTPSEEQRSRGAQDFQRHYDDTVAPKILNFYRRNGELEKAEAFRAYMKDEQVRRGMGHWTRAVMAAQIGDEEEFIEQLSSAYNTDGYFDDGLSINPGETRFIRDGDDVIGAELVFINDRTGESFKRRYESDDLYRLGIDSLSMESAFEDQFARYQEGRAAREKAQPSNSDILRTMEYLGDGLRANEDGVNPFNNLSLAEQRRIAEDVLTGGPGLDAMGGSNGFPLLGER